MKIIIAELTPRYQRDDCQLRGYYCAFSGAMYIDVGIDGFMLKILDKTGRKFPHVTGCVCPERLTVAGIRAAIAAIDRDEYDVAIRDDLDYDTAAPCRSCGTGRLPCWDHLNATGSEHCCPACDHTTPQSTPSWSALLPMTVFGDPTEKKAE